MVEYDIEYSIVENILLEYNNYKLAPVIDNKMLFYYPIFEMDIKTKGLSIMELIDEGVDPFNNVFE